MHLLHLDSPPQRLKLTLGTVCAIRSSGCRPDGLILGAGFGHSGTERHDVNGTGWADRLKDARPTADMTVGAQSSQGLKADISDR
jgi:hypothetical protein